MKIEIKCRKCEWSKEVDEFTVYTVGSWEVQVIYEMQLHKISTKHNKFEVVL